MLPFRFLHTSDLHLGKPFGVFAEKDRLAVARRHSLTRLIAIAREHDVAHILIAGDVFDTPNPAPATWRQAAAEMAEAADIAWWLIPGNHDNLRESSATWHAMIALEHSNVHILTEPKTVFPRPDVALLPAPLTRRRGTSDPTMWMDAATTPPDVIRIGLAHGAVTGFDSDGPDADIIAPDRDKYAKLDYLALGDWHRHLKVSDRVWYSGTPERDRFKHNGPGQCLIVEIEAPQKLPQVTPVPVGQFNWQLINIELLPGDDVAHKIREALPTGARRDILVRIDVAGRARLSDTSALATLEQDLAPEFCHLSIHSKDLHLEVAHADLDAIAPSGALRQAGDALAQEASDPSISERDRALAEAALRRLHAIVVEGQE